VGSIQGLVTGAITLSLYVLVAAAVWRLFQMATDLSEIKAILADIRRNTATAAKPIETAARPAPPPVPAGPISLESAEALLREVAAESKTTV
jgi:hypothetical protein